MRPARGSAARKGWIRPVTQPTLGLGRLAETMPARWDYGNDGRR